MSAKRFVIRIHFRRINQLVVDILVFVFSYVAAYVIRFEGVPSGFFLKQLFVLLPYIIIARALSFYVLSVYSIVWRYISVQDALVIFEASIPVSAILFAGRIILPHKLSLLKVPLSVIALEFLFVLVGTSGVRVLRRLIFELRERENLNIRNRAKTQNILLIGAGNAGNLVAKELKQRTDLGLKVVGFIDDDAGKFNTVIQGFRVLGNTTRIPEIIKKRGIDEAIITIANASSKDIRRIVDICESTKIKVRIIPGLFEILDDRVRITKIREINIDDLLGRNVINLEDYFPEIAGHYKNKRILVTGAGGSIGSELCRQLAAFRPRELILLDKDENSIYEVLSLLNNEFEGFPFVPLIANIKNEERLRSIFGKYQPEILFHAAAHKHVPLMESNISEAILNNVMGTRNAAQLAHTHGVERFINISTDKAVNPTSIMGASKRIGEILIQEIAAKGLTSFSVVRFGNVLGSRGSVVPLFQKQIAQGGPITITHPDMKRYFMSLSEAVQLIIQAGTLGNKGEIFVLDMGEQVRILDLTKDLLRLSGQKEGDIEIKFTGSRPGEKLSEEMLVDEERMKATKFKKIFISPPIDVDSQKFWGYLSDLLDSAQKGDEQRIIACLEEMGIGYHSYHEPTSGLQPPI